MSYYKIIYLLLLSLLFASCSTISKKSQNIETISLSENLANICLSGEGRGRMTGSKQKIYFNFEAINNLDKKQWALAFAIPLYGEEILRIDWSDPKSFKAHGKIVKRLYMNMGKNKALMIQSFKTIVAFLNMHAQKKQLTCNKECEIYNHIVKTKSSSKTGVEFNLRGKKIGDPELRVKAFDFDKYFKRLELNLYGNGPLLSLSLFYSSCGTVQLKPQPVK